VSAGTPHAARWDGADLVVQVRVQPRARRNAIVGVDNGRLRISTTASPTDGKANKAVIGLLAEYLRVAPSRIVLRRGRAQRDKQLVVRGPLRVPEGLAVAIDATNGL
jgi:uncharacterized protein